MDFIHLSVLALNCYATVINIYLRFINLTVFILPISGFWMIKIINYVRFLPATLSLLELIWAGFFRKILIAEFCALAGRTGFDKNAGGL
jgi:hypothetical protein